MKTYIIKKLFIAILTVIGVITVTFLLLYLSGDPVATILPPEASAADIEEFREKMGFNQPIIVQWAQFFGQVAQFDFGESYISKQPVIALISDRAPASLILTAAGFLVSIAIAIPLGVISAIKRFSIIDNIVTLFALLGQAMPIYWLGILLVILFGLRLGWLPISGNDTPKHLILPAITLGVSLIPIVMRMTRSAMNDVLEQDYIRTAKAFGISKASIFVKYGLKNAILPVIAVVFVQAGTLLSGAVVTETVFAWPGLGRLATTAILAGDYPLVRALVILSTVFVVFANLMGDILIAKLDARIRFN